ncbi:beta strand repeat-containing protein, partial [Leeuwenhoekiella aequorea]
MKHFYILILGCLFFGVHLGHAQINLNTCDEYTGDLDFVLTFESVDGSGRNIYQTNPINGDQPCPGLGVCEFRIAWNVTLNRWEVLAEDGDGDFATSFVLYSNTSASSPNPPDLTLGTWQENTALTGGECMALQELSGDVQSTLNSNTAPIATAPSAPFVIEDGINVALPDDIQVFDPDGDNQTLTFTITGGTLALGSTGINFGGSGNGSSNFTALGNLTNINNALDVATFTPTPNLSGVNTASISFVSNDGITNSNTASVTFDIEPINDAPIFNGNRVISYTENGSPTKFNSGGNIILSEPEGDDIIEATITFNDQISGDILSVETPSPYSVSQSGNEIKLQGTGSVAQMITALESIEYSFNGNDPTSGETDNSRNISIVVKEASGLSSNSMTVQVSINALNDDPTFTGLPSTISVLEDVASVIDLSAATFGDVDSDSGSVTLSLSVSAGTLTAISGSGVTVSFPITGTMNLNGTAAAIENYLNTPSNINYTNESGSNTATLNISANDNGNSGSGGGTLISFGTININVNSIPSVTSVIVPANRTYLANQNLDFTINFSEAVDVNTTIGTPELNIVIGANTKSAVYVSGSGSSALVFRYVVASGVYDTDGISITGLNTSGGTIRNPSGSDANLMLNNVGNTTNILVNGCDLTASGVATAVSCNGGSDASIDLAVVGGTASYTYLWSNGATTEDLSGLTAGTYDVTVTDANGCTATASIQVNEPTILTASGVATAVSCNGGSDASIDLAVVGGTTSYTYLWSNGATTEDLSGLTAGTYDVTVTDANGCTATASIQVNEPTILTAS